MNILTLKSIDLVATKVKQAFACQLTLTFLFCTRTTNQIIINLTVLAQVWFTANQSIPNKIAQKRFKFPLTYPSDLPKKPHFDYFLICSSRSQQQFSLMFFSNFVISPILSIHLSLEDKLLEWAGLVWIGWL